MSLHILPFCFCSLTYLLPSGESKAPSALPNLSGSYRLITFFTAHPREEGFLNAASAVVTPTSTFHLPTGHFVGLLPVSPLRWFYQWGFTPAFNEISPWRTCIYGQFSILRKMLAPGASKSSEGNHMTSGHLSEKNENFCSHKNMYTNFIGDVLAITKGLKTNPNVRQLVTR